MNRFTAMDRSYAVRSSRRGALATVALVVVLAMTSCTSSVEADQTTSTVIVSTSPVAGCADVVAATIDSTGNTYRVSATILSADAGWDKYADAWEVRGPDGTILGTRILAHPHVDEQPFTRSLDDVGIPAGVTQVEIAARDSMAGFCGDTLSIAVPGG